MGKTIITCAVTGAIHTPSMSKALPYTFEQIAEQAIAAAEAGAAILHLHARNPDSGKPSIDPDHFMEFLPQIRRETDAVINISTGGSLTANIADRVAPALRASPEMCSLNMGSINFSIHPLADRMKEFEFDWEEAYIRGSEANIFRNTFSDIAEVARVLDPHDVKYEHECYDVGHLYNLKFCVDRGLFRAPIFLQFVMGILGGIAAEVENLIFMKSTADRLFGKDYQWSVLGAGNAQMKLASVGAQLGGHVRVGLEDSLFIEKGRLAESNAQQVVKVRRILEEQGNVAATPDEARSLLSLKGADRVSF